MSAAASLFGLAPGAAAARRVLADAAPRLLRALPPEARTPAAPIVSPAAPGGLRLHGPLAIRSGELAVMLRTGRIPAGLPVTAWQGVVTADGAPLASIEIPVLLTRQPGTARGGAGAVPGAAHGAAAAAATLRAIDSARALALARRWPQGRREICLLRLAEVHATAVWLPGRPSVFFLVTLGSAQRVDPHPLGTAALLRLLGRAARHARPPRPATKPNNSGRRPVP